VRLHSLKDYADLAGVLAEEPRVPHAANLVPALLDQIALLAEGRATDAFLDVARQPASSWGAAEVDFLLDNFFSAHPARMIDPLPRYAELARKRRAAAPGGREALRKEFSREDLRDLVVLFHLAWSGETLKGDPLVAKLRRRGRGFTEDERQALLDTQAEFLKTVLPAWRKAFASGVVEAATSPYHHPILPLLVDAESAREAVPRMPLPGRRFRHPEDARAQLALGLDTFERHFGFRPRGVWPPEGAISEAALAIAAEAGVAWVASDEEILLESLPPAERAGFGRGDRARKLFRPYRVGPSPAVFFRDRVLSDRIGFSYATWTAEDAARDFVTRLLEIRDAAPESDLTVPVILDGENAWESYPENGHPFLRALAAALAKEPLVETTTPSRLLESRTPAALERLVAGSWIAGNLATWIGSPSKNRAWELLAAARDELAAEVATAPAVPPPDALLAGAAPAAVAKAALLAAEASDWFWWFGDDHTSAHDPVFDALFRTHLSAAYQALGKRPPETLETPVELTKSAIPVLSTTPISPVLNGARPDYFEWLGAARLSGQPRGAMNRSAGLLKQVFLGVDPEGATLYVRLDPAHGPASHALSGHRLRVLLKDGHLAEDQRHSFLLPLDPGIAEHDGCVVGVDRIVEVGLPFATAGSEEPIEMRLVLLDADGRELEAVPTEGWARFRPVLGDWSV
jgi:alpha-amylase/alpha-mannosidase (GH57 family)